MKKHREGEKEINVENEMIRQNEVTNGAVSMMTLK